MANSDDILYPNALRRIAEAYEASPGSIIAGNVAVFCDGKPEECRTICQRHLNVHDMVAIWSRKRRYSQPGVFFPRQAYQQTGGIDEALHLCMDLDLMVRMLRLCPVAYVSQIVAGARLHPQSKTCSQGGAQVAEAYQVSRRYWGELPHPRVVSRLLSILGLGRCALGRIYHRNLAALDPILREMISMAAK